MARPIKQGLDYFPFDVDFFSDEKIVAIGGEFGTKGEITTIKLLCAVYRNGYFIEWSEMLKFKLLKELTGVSAELLDQIVNRLVKWEFFDKNLFDSASILTSKGIQRRFQAISTKMHRKNAIGKYSLLDLPQTAPSPEPPEPKAKSRTKKRVAKSEAPTETPEPVPVFNTKGAPVTLEESVAIMLVDTTWNEPVCMRFNLTPEQFKQKVANFRLHCIGMERREHDDVNDAKRHFCTLLAQGKLDDIKSTHADTPADYTYTGGFGSKDS